MTEGNEAAGQRWREWMLQGDFEAAWRESDSLSVGELWDGLPFDGKRVVIRCLHGYGDAIQFLRYAKLVGQRAARVIVETHPEMVSLLRGLAGADEVRTWANGDAPRREEWDQQIEVTELPRTFRTTVDTIPVEFPYIRVSEEARARSRRALGQGGRPKVGLMWASSAWNPARCMRLADLAPVLEVSGCSFYSFQRGAEREELRGSGLGIHDTALHSPEIADTAADMMNMDLLITVDTMAAHLAGALGRRVWTMLPWEADWRWMREREDTPWYPTMRLFRQRAAGDWGSVAARVAGELGTWRHTIGGN